MLGITGSGDHALKRAVGCSMCDQTGYRGRTGIYELIVVDEALRGMIHDQLGEDEMLRHARLTVPSLAQHGYRKVLAGETSLEEVLRVTQEG